MSAGTYIYIYELSPRRSLRGCSSASLFSIYVLTLIFPLYYFLFVNYEKYHTLHLEARSITTDAIVAGSIYKSKNL